MERNNVIALPPELAAKARLAMTGTRCFVACLGGAVNLLALSALCEIIGVPLCEGIASPMIAAGGILFAGCFASFGLVLSGVLKEPRDADLRPHLASALPGVVVVFCATMGAFALIITGGGAWIILSLYRETGMVIFMSIVYFLFASAFFALSVCGAIAWNAITRHCLPLPLRKMVSRHAPGKSGGAEEEKPTRGMRILTRMDAILGSAFGTAFGLLMERTGSAGVGENPGTTSPASGIMITGVTILICIFATVMVLRGIRNLIDLQREPLFP